MRKVLSSIALAALALLPSLASAQAAKGEWQDVTWSTGSEEYTSAVLSANQVLLAGSGYYDAGYGYAIGVAKAGGAYKLTALPREQVKTADHDYREFVETSLNDPGPHLSFQRRTLGGRELLIQKYDQQTTLFERTTLSLEGITERSIRRWLAGSYYHGPKTFGFNEDGTCTWMDTEELTYTVMRENERVPVPVIRLSNGLVLMFIVTADGLDLYEAVEDDGEYCAGNLYLKLYAEEGQPRWTWLSTEPFLRSDLLGMGYDNDEAKAKKLLRIVRNEIFARKGWRFSSADLDQYFRDKAWYKPAADNSRIQFTPMEQLNADVIKGNE